MRTVNSVTLLGNIARLPEIKITSGGKKFATFVIATHKDASRDQGRSTVSEFHNIVAWGNLSSIAENFCQKGRLVYIEGYLKTRSWEHENGAKIFRTEIVATNIIALNSDSLEDEPHSGLVEGVKTNDANDHFFDASEDDFFK